MNDDVARRVVAAIRTVPGVVHLYPARSVAKRVIGLISDRDGEKPEDLIAVTEEEGGRLSIAVSLATSADAAAAQVVRDVERAAHTALRDTALTPAISITVAQVVEVAPRPAAATV